MIEEERLITISPVTQRIDLESGTETEQTPETERYLPVNEIAQIRDKTWQWVIRHITVYKDQVTRVNERGIVNSVLFPEILIDQLGHVPDGVRNSGGWLTTRDMSDELKIDYNWVVRRLLDLTASGEMRLSDVKGEPTVHFSPEALGELRRLKEEVTISPNPDEEFNIAQLARLLNRHPFWVEKILTQKGIDPVYRMHKIGRVHSYYPKVAYEMLKDEDRRYEALGEWLTIPLIADDVGMDREWVIGKLQDLGVVGELKEHPNFRRVYISYPPNIIPRLKRLAQSRRNPEEGWMTENAIVAMIGRSPNWVRRRIKIYKPLGGRRIDARGALRIHYPPEFVEELLNIRYDDETGWT